MKKNSKPTPGTSRANSNGRAAAKKAAPRKTSTAQQKAEDNDEDNNSEEKKPGGSLLEKFFMDQLQDIYFAEKQILKALPKMMEACTTQELKDAFNDHLQQTEGQVERLENVFEVMGKKASGKKCEAILGIVKEADSIIEDTKEGSMTRDAALIIAAQKVEHYEIATYGGLVQLAITIGQREAADLLDETLMEEEQTDRSLTDIAESFINIEAEEETLYSSRQNNNRGRQNHQQNTGNARQKQRTPEMETME